MSVAFLPLALLVGCSDSGASAPMPSSDAGGDAMVSTGTDAAASDVPAVPRDVPAADAAVTAATLESAIYATSCAVPSCHVGPGPAGSLDLSAGNSRAALVNVHAAGVQCGGTSAVRVVPGNATASLLYQKVAVSPPPCGAGMPLGLPALEPTSIQLIAEWINQGAH